MKAILQTLTVGTGILFAASVYAAEAPLVVGDALHGEKLYKEDFSDCRAKNASGKEVEIPATDSSQMTLLRDDQLFKLVISGKCAKNPKYRKKKKIAFLYSAMRHFAEELRAQGWRVDYVRLEDVGNTGSFTGEIERAVAQQKPDTGGVTEPGEWRVRAAMETLADRFDVPVDILEDDRFIATHQEFRDWTEGRTQ